MIKTSQRGSVLVIEIPAWDAGASDELTRTWRELEDQEEILGAIVNLSASASLQRTLPPGVFLGWPALPLSTRKPVVASIEGSCYGTDFELALSCDLRIASESASMGLPSRDSTYAIASVLLPRSTSAGIALELLLSGRTLSASEMLEASLINRAVPAGTALNRALEILTDVLTRSSRNGGLDKQLLLELSGLPLPYIMSRLRTP